MKIVLGKPKRFGILRVSAGTDENQNQPTNTMSTTPRYKAVPSQVWIKKPGFEHVQAPARVSVYGSLPSPREAYEIKTEGWSIFDSKSNTYSNFFFGKRGIETEEEANAIIERLMTPPLTVGDWTLDNFKTYLESTLIPDLKETGMEATAEDFETALAFIRALAK